MIASDLKVNVVRYILGSVCDYLNNSELQAIIDFWDAESDSELEVDNKYFEGWMKVGSASEACERTMYGEEFKEKKERIEKELGKYAKYDDGSFTKETEDMFKDYLSYNYYIIDMFDYILYKDKIDVVFCE